MSRTVHCNYGDKEGGRGGDVEVKVESNSEQTGSLLVVISVHLREKLRAWDSEV